MNNNSNNIDENSNFQTVQEEEEEEGETKFTHINFLEIIEEIYAEGIEE